MFLQEKIRFTDIFDLIEYTLDSFKPCRDDITLEKILEADVEARRTVCEMAKTRIKM